MSGPEVHLRTLSPINVSPRFSYVHIQSVFFTVGVDFTYERTRTDRILYADIPGIKDPPTQNPIFKLERRISRNPHLSGIILHAVSRQETCRIEQGFDKQPEKGHSPILLPILLTGGGWRCPHGIGLGGPSSILPMTLYRKCSPYRLRRTCCRGTYGRYRSQHT